MKWAAAGDLGIPTSLADMSANGLLILLVALVIVSLFRGWLIPKVHYQNVVKRADILQSTIDDLMETNAVQARTIDKQTVVGDTVIRVMSAVQDARTGSDSS